jgi:hypothetical protein
VFSLAPCFHTGPLSISFPERKTSFHAHINELTKLFKHLNFTARYILLSLRYKQLRNTAIIDGNLGQSTTAETGRDSNPGQCMWNLLHTQLHHDRSEHCGFSLSLLFHQCSMPGMSNMRPAGRTRPFASTPAARTKDTVIWSFNGQNCSFYHLNWINVRRSQKNGMLFYIQNVFYTWKYDRLFPSVKNILNKENILYARHVKHAARGRRSCVALMTTQM